jgi:hypothetical protein
VSVMEEFGNNDIGCTSLNVIIPATSYMTCIPTLLCSTGILGRKNQVARDLARRAAREYIACRSRPR